MRVIRYHRCGNSQHPDLNDMESIVETRHAMRRLRKFIIRLSLQWKIALSIFFSFIIILPTVSLTLFYFTNILQRLTVVIDQDVTLGRMASTLSLTMLDMRRYERNYRMFGSQIEQENVQRLIAYADSILVVARDIAPSSEKQMISEISNHLEIYSNSFLMLVEHVSQNPPETIDQKKSRLSMRLNDFQAAYRKILSQLDAVVPAERDSIYTAATRDLDIFSIDMLSISDTKGQPAYIQENLDRSREMFLAAVDNLGERSWDNMRRHRLESLQTEARAKRNIITVLIVTGFVCIFMVSYLPKYIVRPIKYLNSIFRKAEEGDLKAIASYISNDEIGDLARSYNRMLERLQLYDTLKTQKIASQKRAFDRLLENLDVPACILTGDLVAVFFNASFISLFESDVPAKPPDGGLDLKQIESMSVFVENIRNKLDDIPNTLIVEFTDIAGNSVAMKGRVVRNTLMKLESIVLIGTTVNH